MSATQKVFSATLTLRTNWPGFALPLIALSVFVVILGFRSLARVAEFIAGWVFFAAVAMLLFSLSKTDFTELLPILANGFTPVGTGALNHTFFFTDSLFIIFLLSRIKKERKMFRSPITAFLIGAVITILLYVVFYALFGDIAWLQDSAMPKVSQFNTTLTSNGRLDWLTVVIWLAAIFINHTFLLLLGLQYSRLLPLQRKSIAPSVFDLLFASASDAPPSSARRGLHKRFFRTRSRQVYFMDRTVSAPFLASGFHLPLKQKNFFGKGGNVCQYISA